MTAPLLHRARRRHDVRRRVVPSRSATRVAPARGRARSHRVLSDVRRPAFDTGTLGGAHVVDVIEDDDGRRRARRRSARSAAGAAVHGVDRRAAPLRPHAAAHGPARAVGRVRRAAQRRTVSFHLGSRRLDHRPRARSDAGRDRGGRGRGQPDRLGGPRRSRSGSSSADEAAALPLRKESVREGELRLIDIADFDLSACGGTHVSAHRRDWPHRACAAGSSSRAARGSSSSAAAARCARFRELRDAVPARRGAVGAAARAAGRDREAPGREPRPSP